MMSSQQMQDKHTNIVEASVAKISVLGPIIIYRFCPNQISVLYAYPLMKVHAACLFVAQHTSL